MLVVLLLGITALHYLIPPVHLFWHNVFQRLYYVPLLLACAWLGLRGGLVVSAICILLYAPHIWFHWANMKAYQLSQVMELGMLALIGMLAGTLSDRARASRREAVALVAERDRALADLESSVQTLRKADRLATLGTLVAGMAHEVRNPLAAMQGAVEIIADDYGDGNPHKEFVEILQLEMHRLGRVTGKYLDFARPQVPDLRPVDVTSAVRAAIGLLDRTASRAGVTFESRLPDGVSPALADPVQIHQALVNLLLNAVQSMPSGGRVTVTVASVSDDIVIEVVDQGEGLPDGPVERIFEPFFSTKSGGTGLGLAMAKQIADSHGGNLTAEDGAGRGCVFRLVLPRAPVMEKP